MKKLKFAFNIKLCILVFFGVVVLSIGMKLLIESKINVDINNPYKNIYLGDYKGFRLYLLIGDITIPSKKLDDKVNQKKYYDLTENYYNSYIVSSALTKYGESWTLLSRSVASRLSRIDPYTEQKFKNSIFSVNPDSLKLRATKEFIIDKNSTYYKNFTVDKIYIASIFNNVNKTHKNLKSIISDVVGDIV